MDWTSLLGGMGGGGGGGKTTSSTAQSVIGSRISGDQADNVKWIIGGGLGVLLILGLFGLVLLKRKG